MDPTKVKRLLAELFSEILPALTDALAAISVDDAVMAEPTESEHWSTGEYTPVIQEPEPEPEKVTAHTRRRKRRPTHMLTTRQKAFCALVAQGKPKSEAYRMSYTIQNPLPSSADSAARKLLRQKKIRDCIDRCRAELGAESAFPEPDSFDQLRNAGAHGGWAFRLTPNQERFCQHIAQGSSPEDAFRASGYQNEYTEEAMTQKTQHMLSLPKLQRRIAALKAGNAPEITTATVGRRPRKEKVATVVEEAVEETVSEPEEEVAPPPPPAPASRRPSTTTIGSTNEIPALLLGALTRYSQNHIQPGGFLTALLSNDLHIALRLASPTSLSSLPEILRYVQKHLPALAYGSPEKVMAWLDSGKKREWRALPEGADLIRTANAGAVQDYLDAAHDVGEAAGEAD